jgi:hypothetical protein
MAMVKIYAPAVIKWLCREGAGQQRKGSTKGLALFRTSFTGHQDNTICGLWLHAPHFV